MGILRTWLMIALVAPAPLASAPFTHPTSAPLAQAKGLPYSNAITNLTPLIERANKLRSEGKPYEEIRIWREILAITEKEDGPGHPNVADCLSILAALLAEQGQYAAAEALGRRSLAINERVHGPDHLDVARSLDGLAGVIQNSGQYAAAESLSRRSLAIREKVLGPDHPDIATSINHLASALTYQGQYIAAEPLYRRSLAVTEKTHGPNHLSLSITITNLGLLLSEQGQYAAAEALLRRSLDIKEKNLRPDHPAVGRGVNDLAGVLSQQGQYTTAEQLYRRSLAILEKALGLDHPDVATIIKNLGNVLSDQGKYAAAEPLYRRSLAINSRALGPNHAAVASSIDALASVLRLKGQYSASELLYRRSLAIYEKALGPNHPFFAGSLANLAALLAVQGQYIAAEPLVRRSLAINERALAPDHPRLTTDIENLALVLCEQGLYKVAMPILQRSIGSSTNWLVRELPLLPDQSRSAQLRRLGKSWEWVFGLIDRHSPAAKLALEIRLNRQGLLSEVEQRQALLLNAPGVDRVKVEQLQALTQQLASVSLSADRRTAVREQRDKLQAEIYRQIPDLQLQLVNTSAVAKVLPADGALVEFQRYRPFDGRKPQGQRWGADHYIALVLKPNGSISSVALGPAAAIDAQVHKALKVSADGLSDAEAIWAQLSTQVLKPLLPQLTDSRQWFLSPDGELNRVPFAALPAPQQMGTPLAQAVQLRLLTTGRELVRLQQPAPPGGEALVMANPNYDRPSTKKPPAARPDAVATVVQRRSAELGSNQWQPLFASEREGQKVANLLGTGLTGGAAATTTVLQRRQGPRVLHIATHGFFVADKETKPTEALRAIQEGSPLLRSLRQEDPQLRSGLVFAGANQPDLDPNDDGYLTAAEAVTLNLKGTELVVLSACSTGQGEVRTGEGVYGLQRSLTVAGARSTLLSLWKVDDAATAEFMGRYYQRLKSGEGRSDALAAVQAEFRSGKVQSPSGASWKEPYYWAAWQLVGDWRPIKGL